MRLNLKLFRVKENLTLREMAEKIGCKTSTYAAIEKGIRNGKQDFWLKLQQAFEVPDTEIWTLMHKEESEQENEATS